MRKITRSRYKNDIDQIIILNNDLNLSRDKAWFKYLIGSLFNKNDILLFKCLRENTDAKNYSSLKEGVPEYFKKFGDYIIFSASNLTLGAFGLLEYWDSHLDFVIDVWNDFENVLISSIPVEQIDSFTNDFNFQSPYTNIEKVIYNFTPVILSKGLDPVSMRVYVINDHNTENINSALS